MNRLTMAGIHYAAKSRGDLLSSGLGGALVVGCWSGGFNTSVH
jgi:hypothetical protein